MKTLMFTILNGKISTCKSREMPALCMVLIQPSFSAFLVFTLCSQYWWLQSIIVTSCWGQGGKTWEQFEEGSWNHLDPFFHPLIVLNHQWYFMLVISLAIYVVVISYTPDIFDVFMWSRSSSGFTRHLARSGSNSHLSWLFYTLCSDLTDLTICPFSCTPTSTNIYQASIWPVAITYCISLYMLNSLIKY